MTKTTALSGPTTIQRHAASVFSSLAMLAGMQLDVFTPLKDGPMTCSEIATTLGVRPERLRPLLYALVNAELLTVTGDRFANTAESDEFLVRGEPRYFGGMHLLYADQWQKTLQTAASIRTGVPQAKMEFVEGAVDELAAVFQSLHPGSIRTGKLLAEVAGLNTASHLVDIGGGSGGLAIGACQICPSLRATVADLPNITPVAARFIAEAGLGHRIETLDVDVVTGPPTGRFDAAVLSRFIQVLSPADARAALRHVGQAMMPGGRVFIVGRVLADTRQSPKDTVGQNLFFLNVYDHGQAYTEQEHRAWLTEAGFEDIAVTFESFPGGLSLVSARKQTAA